VVLTTLNIRTKVWLIFHAQACRVNKLSELYGEILKIKEEATETSYGVSCRMVLAGEAHTVAETLLKQYAVEMTPCVIGEPKKKKLETGQLSNNAVKLGI